MNSDMQRKAVEAVERMYVSDEPRQAAALIDGVIEERMLEYGILRTPGPRRLREHIAKVVQLAIDKAMGRVDA
jgi:hypothetical protein